VNSKVQRIFAALSEGKAMLQDVQKRLKPLLMLELAPNLMEVGVCMLKANAVIKLRKVVFW
jgi:hypothetical protein